MQLAGVSALAFAVGVYLPLATTLPIFVGGMARGLVDRSRKFTSEEADMSPGTLMSTGLIAGGSLAGIIIALLVVPAFENVAKSLDFSQAVPGGEPTYLIWAMAAFGAMVAALLLVALLGRRPLSGKPGDGERARLGEIGVDD
jgi:hypothetical protein